MPRPRDNSDAGATATPETIFAKIEQTPHAELVHDESTLRQTLVELMTASPHPVLAEMGRELASGRISWQGLAGIPAYQEVLSAGLTSMEHIDLDEIAAELDATAELDAAAEPATPLDTEPASDDGNGAGDEIFFRGLDQRW